VSCDHCRYHFAEPKWARWFSLPDYINGKPSCLCFAAFKVEQAVVDMVLEACQPMAIEASL
jgi:hypothetical protein